MKQTALSELASQPECCGLNKQVWPEWEQQEERQEERGRAWKLLSLSLWDTRKDPAGEQRANLKPKGLPAKPWLSGDARKRLATFLMPPHWSWDRCATVKHELMKSHLSSQGDHTWSWLHTRPLGAGCGFLDIHNSICRLYKIIN